eukprot:m.120369 g.120369  ORF g.120369 m.120369 type:complete len:1063 (+) comp28799_c0_seq10:108-3296(+)
MSGYYSGYSSGSDELVFRRVRAILNKLTVDKFDVLADQLVRVGISNENVLKGIIILLFEKAVDEPKFCPIYAQLCVRLSEQDGDPTQQVSADQPRKPSTFLTLLLRKCKDEFENRSRAEELAKVAGPISRCTPGTEEFRQTLAAHAELKKAREKMLGNIKFIGELGKRSLLSEKNLHDCLHELCVNVEQPVGEDIECLCQLLRTVGRQLDHDKAKSWMDTYFARMQQMREGPNVAPRMQFMLEDIMELRDNKWIERELQQAAKEGPKSIRDIRLQAMEEQIMASGKRPSEKQYQLQKIRQSRGPGMGGMQMGEGVLGGPIMPPSFLYGGREGGIPSQPGMFSGMKRQEALFPEHLQQAQSQGYGGNEGHGNAHGQGHSGYEQSSQRQYVPDGDRYAGPRGERQPQPPPQHYQNQNQNQNQNYQNNHSPNHSQNQYRNNGQSENRYNGDRGDHRGGGGGGGDRGGHRNNGYNNNDYNNSNNDHGNNNAYGNNSPQEQFASREQFPAPGEVPRGSTQHRGGNNNDRGDRDRYPQQQGSYRDGSQQGGDYNNQDRYNRGGGQQQRYNDNRNNNSNSSSATFDAMPHPPPNMPAASRRPGNIGLPGVSSRMGRLKLGEISLRPASDLGLNSKAILQTPVAPVVVAPSVVVTGKITARQTKLPTADKKKKKLTKDQLEQMGTALIDEYLTALDVNEACKCFEDMKTPKYATKLTIKAILIVLDRNQGDRASVCKMIHAFVKHEFLTSELLLESIEQVLPQIPDLAIDIPKVEEYMAIMIATWVGDEILEIDPVATMFCPGYESFHSVIFSNILKQLKVVKGEEWVKDMFVTHKLDIRESLMKEDRTEIKLSTLLKKVDLKFLYPMLCMKDDLFHELDKHIPTAVKDMETDAVQLAVRSIFKWLQSLDASMQNSKEFIITVGFCIIAHVAKLTTLVPTTTPEGKKQMKVDEKTTLQALAAILEKYVTENVTKQVDIIYALQTFCFDHKFPKGMMLRWSVHLYELDVVEGESWLSWKEEVNYDIPGKGDALIETNDYLNWIKQEMEEESESEDEEDDIPPLPKKGAPKR